jgi:hypothetical protein
MYKQEASSFLALELKFVAVESVHPFFLQPVNVNAPIVATDNKISVFFIN